MKHHPIIFVLAIFFMVNIAAAQELDKVVKEEQTKKSELEYKQVKRKKQNRAYTLVYPITLTYDDGSTRVVSDEKAHKEARQQWKNEGHEGKSPKVTYPYDVKLADGSIKSITSQLDMAAMKRELGAKRKRNNKKKADNLVYPVNVATADGNTVIVQNKEEFGNIMKQWKASGDEKGSRPQLVFPYQITLEDGTTQTIHSKEDIKSIRKKNYKKNKRKRDRPFEIVFPVQMTTDGESPITIESKEDMRAYMKSQREKGGQGERPQFVFPIDVMLKDGSTKTIQSKEELKALGRELKESKRKK